MDQQRIETDYLIIGAGAMGLAFADALCAEDGEAKIVIVDKRSRAGGHWVDAYPYVTLHQPAAAYGVNSRKLGRGGADLSSHSELLFYFEEVMKTLLDSGRVQFFSMTEFEDAKPHPIVKSVVNPDRVQEVVVHRKIVDASYMNVQVPASHPPRYEVSDDVHLIPLNGLIKLKKSWKRYTIIGGGKTAIDAVLFLLDQGVNPDLITWIIPNDMWLWNRALVQTDNVGKELIKHVITTREANSVEAIFDQLEASQSVFKLDPNIRPTKWRCATVAPEEYQQLLEVKHIVRQGRVSSISASHIVLEQGEIPTDTETLHIDCSANGLSKRPQVPIFQGDRITLQSVFMCQQVFSAAIIGKMETLSMSDARRNQIWQVIPHPEQVSDYPESLTMSFENVIRGNRYMPIWLWKSRLNIMTHQSTLGYLRDAFNAILAVRGIRKHSPLLENA